MICNNCNSQIADNSTFCSKCGTKIQNDVTLENNTLPKGNIAGFILGLVSIIAWFIPFIGFPVAIVGIVLSSMNLKTQSRKLNIIGLVLCCVFLLVTMINSALGAAYFMFHRVS